VTERVFGLTVNEVMAYAAIANVVLVLLLAVITTYYAWHAKRQADASHQEVAASKRQNRQKCPPFSRSA
jgi:type II secretory pathway component PulL